VEWLQGMTFFIFSNLNDVIERHKTRPTRQNQESTAAFTQSVSQWDRRQELAQAGVRERIGYNGKSLIQATTTAAEMMATLEAYYRPRGIGVFSELCRKLDEIRRTEYQSVMEYGEAFRRIDNELIALDQKLALPEPYLIQKYLLGLGEKYASLQ